MCPFAHEQIQTSSHAGGIASERVRWSVSGSAIVFPVVSSTYENPRPRRTRRIPGKEQSARRRRGMRSECPLGRGGKRADSCNYAVKNGARFPRTISLRSAKTASEKEDI